METALGRLSVVNSLLAGPCLARQAQVQDRSHARVYVSPLWRNQGRHELRAQRRLRLRHHPANVEHMDGTLYK
jgi:hypothetical protein